MKQSWKTVLAVLGVILPAVFSYLSARAESSEAKIRAEIAYVTLQDSVKELQSASYAHALELAEIRGQLKVEKREHAEYRHPESHFVGPLPPPEGSSDGDGIDAEEPAPAPVQMKAPPAFNEAVNIYKAKK